MITLKHTSTDSSIVWFILAFLGPWTFGVTWLIWFYKACKIIAAHKKQIDQEGTIFTHKSVEGWGLYFGLMILSVALSIASNIIFFYTYKLNIFSLHAEDTISYNVFTSSLGILSVVLGIVSFILSLYVIWKFSEIIDGHQEGVIENNVIGLIHKRNISGGMWFAMYLLGIVTLGLTTLYWFWKGSKIIAGHTEVLEQVLQSTEQQN